MRLRMMVGIAIGALIVAKAGSAKSQEVEPNTTTVAIEVAAPMYAYGPQLAEPPNFRPRYDRRYTDRPWYGGTENDRSRYGDRNGNRGYGSRRESYNGNGYRDYGPKRKYGGWRSWAFSNRGADRTNKGYRSRRGAYQNQYAGRVLTPGLRGQWRDLGPIYQLKGF